MEITKVQDGKKSLEIGTSQGSFDQSYPTLLKAGFRFHSAEQEARARKLSERDSCVNRSGTYVNITHIYQPKDSGIVLIVYGKHNPILANPTEAANAHRNGKEFYVNVDKLTDLAERNPKKAIKSGVLALPRPMKKGMFDSSEANPFEVSVDKLAENPYFAFTLRDEAKPYGQFLKSTGIKSVPVYLVNEADTKKESNPFARLLWVVDLDIGSAFYGNVRLLDNGYGRVRGVRSSASAVSASQQKPVEPRQFTYSQLSRMMIPLVAKSKHGKLEEKLRRHF